MSDEGPPPAVPLHTIRLRGAWSAAPEGSRTRHARRFGWPTVLDPHERVWLVCATIPGPAEVALNGSRLADVPAGAGAYAADISSLLQPRNELIITTPAGGVLGEVGLEVRPADSAAG